MKIRMALIALVAPMMLMDAGAAFAQDGRIVMRRPLEAPVVAKPDNEDSNSNRCGGPGNPCQTRQCSYWDPRWVTPFNDPNVCTGSVSPANATCQAFTSSNRSGGLATVPDSVCLEEASSYTARCGAYNG